jgi:hypothetical protein
VRRWRFPSYARRTGRRSGHHAHRWRFSSYARCEGLGEEIAGRGPPLSLRSRRLHASRRAFRGRQLHAHADRYHVIVLYRPRLLSSQPPNGVAPKAAAQGGSVQRAGHRVSPRSREFVTLQKTQGIGGTCLTGEDGCYPPTGRPRAGWARSVWQARWSWDAW